MQRWSARTFIHRDLILRSNGRVRYLPLSPRLQQAFAVVLLVGAGLFSYLSVNHYLYDSIVDAKERDLAETRAALEEALTHLASEGASASEARRSLAALQAALTREIGELQGHLRDLTHRNGVLSGQVVAASGALGEARARSERLAEDRDRHKAQADSLLRRLDETKEIHDSIVQQLREHAVLRIEAIEALLSETGLSLTTASGKETRTTASGKETRESPAGGRGGRFIPLDDDEAAEDADPSRETRAALEELERAMQRWRGLRRFVGALPLRVPLRKYWVSSPFGPRRDPIKKRRAMHEGVDMAASKGTRVSASAAGRVRFAGRRQAYGFTVEIDHGFGIRTRYAHLSKITVKRGQKVGAGERIGLVGSSGRSTGSHLHFELLVDGRPLDPMKLFAAKKKLTQLAQLKNN